MMDILQHISRDRIITPHGWNLEQTKIRDPILGELGSRESHGRHDDKASVQRRMGNT